MLIMSFRVKKKDMNNLVQQKKIEKSVIDVVIVQINVYIFDESNNGLASFIF
jgi:hypothetical protein